MRQVIAGMLLTMLVAGSRPATAAGWSTSGVQIKTPAGGNFVMSGINWYGFETKNYVVNGLYHHDYPFIVDLTKKYGANVLRLPFSNQMWESNPTPGSNTISACPSCKAKHARDILAMIINYAGSVG